MQSIDRMHVAQTEPNIGPFRFTMQLHVLLQFAANFLRRFTLKPKYRQNVVHAFWRVGPARRRRHFKQIRRFKLFNISFGLGRFLHEIRSIFQRENDRFYARF